VSAHRRDPDADLLAAEVARAVERRARTRGMSLRAVARETGIANTTVNRLLDGRHVEVDALVALARWAGYDVVLAERAEAP
jgi:lambda repressor-like predicted transcriptional regulator